MFVNNFYNENKTHDLVNYELTHYQLDQLLLSHILFFHSRESHSWNLIPRIILQYSQECYNLVFGSTLIFLGMFNTFTNMPLTFYSQPANSLSNVEILQNNS